MLSNLYAELYFAFIEKIHPRYVIRRVLTSATIGPLVLHNPKAIALNPNQRNALIWCLSPTGTPRGFKSSVQLFPYFVSRYYRFYKLPSFNINIRRSVLNTNMQRSAAVPEKKTAIFASHERFRIPLSFAAIRVRVVFAFRVVGPRTPR